MKTFLGIKPANLTQRELARRRPAMQGLLALAIEINLTQMDSKALRN